MHNEDTVAMLTHKLATWLESQIQNQLTLVYKLYNSESTRI